MDPSRCRSSRAVRGVLPVVGLLALTALALLASGQTGADLELGPVTYAPHDTDGDGYDDSVGMVATVHNGNETRSRIFVVKLALVLDSEELDVRTASGRLDPGKSAEVVLHVVTRQDGPMGEYGVQVTLSAEELGGDVMGTDEGTISLRPLGDYKLELSANRTSVNAVENTTATFTITVTSMSNNPTEVELNATTSLGWNLTIAPDEAVVEPGGSASWELAVMLPHNGEPGLLETVRLEAVALRNRTAFSTMSVTIMVALQEFDLELRLLRSTVFLATGETVSVQGIVMNMGNNVDEATMTAQLPHGWGAKFDPSVLTVDRGASTPFRIDISAPADLSGAGTLTINVSAYSKGLVERASQVIKVVYNTAELLIDEQNVTFNPATPRAGVDLTVQVAVLNMGAVPVSDVLVLLRFDGIVVAEDQIDTIFVGGFDIASLTWSPTPGDHFIQIIVDPQGKIQEIDEANNVLALDINVISPDLEITAEDIQLMPEYPREDSIAILVIRVWNLGQQTARRFNVQISVDDVVVDNVTFQLGLLSDTNDTQEWRWSVPKGPGKYTIKVEVDPEGEVLEERLENNVASRRFTVNEMPVPSLGSSKEKAYVDDQVSFDASDSFDPDGRVRQYFFDYGDGTDSGWVFSPLINHTFSLPGEYTVRLYVRDDVLAQNDEPATAEVVVQKPGSKKDTSPGPGALTVLLALAVVAIVLGASRHVALTGRRGNG